MVHNTPEYGIHHPLVWDTTHPSMGHNTPYHGTQHTLDWDTTRPERSTLRPKCAFQENLNARQLSMVYILIEFDCPILLLTTNLYIVQTTFIHAPLSVCSSTCKFKIKNRSSTCAKLNFVAWITWISRSIVKWVKLETSFQAVIRQQLASSKVSCVSVNCFATRRQFWKLWNSDHESKIVITLLKQKGFSKSLWLDLIFVWFDVR